MISRINAQKIKTPKSTVILNPDLSAIAIGMPSLGTMSEQVEKIHEFSLPVQSGAKSRADSESSSE